MIPTTLTLISGVVLLLVFALVGWKLKRSRESRHGATTPKTDRSP